MGPPLAAAFHDAGWRCAKQGSQTCICISTPGVMHTCCYIDFLFDWSWDPSVSDCRILPNAVLLHHLSMLGDCNSSAQVAQLLLCTYLLQSDSMLARRNRDQGLDLSKEDAELLQRLLSREDVAHAVLGALTRAQAAAAAAAAASGQSLACPVTSAAVTSLSGVPVCMAQHICLHIEQAKAS